MPPQKECNETKEVCVTVKQVATRKSLFAYHKMNVNVKVMSPLES